MPKMTDTEVIAITRLEIDQARGYDSDTISVKREKALDYYNGKMSRPAEGCNTSVSMDVADTVHALLAQVGPIFQTSIVKFEPESEDDEKQAQLESDFTRRKFQQSHGEQILYESAHDALLIGNGWIKVTVLETKDTKNEQYGRLDEYQIADLIQPTAPNQEVSVSGSMDAVNIKRTTTTTELIVECVPPENMLFSANQAQHEIDNIRLIGERVFYTVSDLIKMGVSAEDAKSIPDYSSDESDKLAREGEGSEETDARAHQDAEIVKECFDVHIRLDLDGNGSSTLCNVIFGGNVLISKEEAECAPYATGSPVPVPHRIQGIGMYEIMRTVQDTKTDILRKFIDNVDVLNMSRVTALEGEVNMDDLTSGRLNGVVRVKTPNAVLPLPAGDVGPQSINALNYMDTVRSQRGGASTDQNNADRQLMASSATAAAGTIQTAERTAGWYAHNLVNTLLASTYRLIHKKLRLEMPGPAMANLRGKWVETDPSQWKERKSIEVLAGMTTTERNNKIMGLTQVISKLEQMIATGGDGIITNRSKLYGAMADWVHASEIGQPEEYLIDPESEEAQKAQRGNQQRQQQQQQAQMQQQQQIMQMQKQIEDAKVEMDRYKVDTETRFKYYDTNLKAEIQETKMTLDTFESNKPQANEPERSN